MGDSADWPVSASMPVAVFTLNTFTRLLRSLATSSQ